MEIFEIIKERHSVRSFTDKKIEGQVKEELIKEIDECNKEANLDIRLVLDEDKAFNTHYGNFENTKNYIVLAGKKSKDLEEKSGYYGERIVLKAQELGLNTCWVALTYDKNKIPFDIPKDEKLVMVIAIGYGKTNGNLHKMKTYEDISKTTDAPDWYKKGIEYVLYAPSAVNQQKIKFELIKDNIVKASTGIGFNIKVDLGIAKYHFELGASKENFKWY